jgi:hypothetical protein
VNWSVFDLVVDDEKTINLKTVFGSPFPRVGNILASKQYDEKSVLPDGSQREPSFQDKEKASINHGKLSFTFNQNESDLSNKRKASIDQGRPIEKGSINLSLESALQPGGRRRPSIEITDSSHAMQANRYEIGDEDGLSDDGREYEDVIRVYLEPHEGQEVTATSPFSILPKQTVS